MHSLCQPRHMCVHVAPGTCTPDSSTKGGQQGHVPFLRVSQDPYPDLHLLCASCFPTSLFSIYPLQGKGR